MRTFAISLVIVTSHAIAVRGQTCASELEQSRPLSAPRGCLLEAGDAIFIATKHECTWGPRIIRPDGKITLPLIGDVQAAHLTPSQLEARITNLLGAYVQHPEITVQVVDMNRKAYYVDGDIKLPGEYLLQAPTTLLDALNEAAGSNPPRHLGKIVVMRGGSKIILNYRHILKHPEENILIQSGDHIVIP